MLYNFEWDPNKAKENKRKHKVSFERATQIFLDPFQISIFDEEHSREEERWITIVRAAMKFCWLLSILLKK